MFDETDAWAERIEESVQGIEFKTLLVGCRVPPIMAESEEMVWSDIGLTSPETLKAQFNREVGKAFSARSGSEVDFKRPDLVAVCNPADNTVEIEINPSTSMADTGNMNGGVFPRPDGIAVNVMERAVNAATSPGRCIRILLRNSLAGRSRNAAALKM